jgi:hypothetical protein
VDVNNIPQLYQDMTEEVVRIFKLFSGITRIDGLVFDWVLRASKHDITIHSCSVPGSDWQAIKSDAIIKCDKKDVLALMIDDDRSKEYDETMEGYEVRLHNVLYLKCTVVFYMASALNSVYFPPLYSSCINIIGINIDFVYYL